MPISSKTHLPHLQPGLKGDQKTNIRIVPRMNAFMQVVQMSHLELQQALEQKLIDNPLLEWGDEKEQWETSTDEWQDEKSHNDEESLDTHEAPLSWDQDTGYTHEAEALDLGQQTYAIDSDSFEQIDEGLPLTNHPQTNVQTTDIENTFESYHVVDEPYYPKNLSDDSTDNSLIEQISQTMDGYALLSLDAENQAKTTLQKQCVSWLIGHLNEKGWIDTPWEEIVTDLIQETGLSKRLLQKELSKALSIIQSLEPAGIGARSLQECLQLQIMRWPQSDLQKQCMFLVTDGYEAMCAKHYSKLSEQLSCTTSAIKSAIHTMATLDFHPGAVLHPSSTDYVMADVIVRKHQEEWQATLNESALPRVRLNRYYASLVWYNRKSKEMRHQLNEAKCLLSDLNTRSQMILKIAEYLVKAQRSFFELGELGMRPLQQKEVADDLGVHPSTISRIIHHKYMDTPRGMLSFQYFFNRGRLLFDSGGHYSATAILSIIKEIIAKEDPLMPLSDDEIVDLLKEQGITLSRRSIAKYRLKHHIPSSHQRRNHQKT